MRAVMKPFWLSAALALVLFQAEPSWAVVYRAIKGESTLSYLLVHPMHKITGVNKDFLCEVELSPDTVSSHIRVSAPITGFDSRNSSRDSHMMEVVNAIKYPRVVFTSQSVKPEGDGYLVSGILDFHGVSRTVGFHVMPKFHGDKVEITGAFEIKLSDYKVKRPTLMLIPVHDELRIDFSLFARL